MRKTKGGQMEFQEAVNRYPKGTTVKYFPDRNEDDFVVTVTKSEVYHSQISGLTVVDTLYKSPVGVCNLEVLPVLEITETLGWEYKFEKGLYSENQQAIDLINEMGVDGWEVIGYDVQSCSDGLVWFRFLLKRRIEADRG